eukprot:989437-Alexandrium_andersonii.AAC.1
MSASLVGSEMCIRDRPSPSISGSFECTSGASGFKKVAHCRAVDVSDRDCLLYTSDAADDM